MARSTRTRSSATTTIASPPSWPNAASSTCSSSATCWRRARRTVASSPRARSTTSIPSRSPRRWPARQQHLGLVATLSTTYNEPYAIAERFASLDHISGGRAGWNVITTANDDAALNFSRKSHMEKTLRYERAKEFVDICKGLWDGWDEDALRADRASGRVRRSREGQDARPPGPVLLRPRRARAAAAAAGLAGAGAGRRLARRAGIRGDHRRADLRRAKQPRRGRAFPRGGEGPHAGARPRPGAAEGAARPAADPGLDRGRGARQGEGA